MRIRVFIFIFVFIATIKPVFLFSQDAEDVEQESRAITNEYETNITNADTVSNFFGTIELPTNTNDEPAILEDIRQMQSGGINTTATFTRAIIGFIVTLVGLYLVYVYLKKRNRKVAGSQDIIRILATTLVASNRYVSVIEVADEIFLIAVADHSISLISKIEDSDSKDQIRMMHAISKSNVVDGGFKSVFDKMLSRLNQPKQKEKDAVLAAQELRDRIERLNPKNESKEE